jgi:hypothetical protein
MTDTFGFITTNLFLFPFKVRFGYFFGIAVHFYLTVFKPDHSGAAAFNQASGMACDNKDL